jgi:CheY-like chemotaxis protein
MEGEHRPHPMPSLDVAKPSARRGSRFRDFHDLMRYRIMDILLVSSPYDTFLLEEAGQLSERLLGEFRNLDLHYVPGLTGVSGGAEALELLRQQRRFNLVVATLHVGDMDVLELARRVKGLGLDVPVVVLAFDTHELKSLLARYDGADVERVFVWQGDARILLAIVKSVEDKRNVAHDTGAVGVQVILLIEDNVRYYSSFLPILYNELLNQSRRLISEAVNLSQKILRMRARPKILLCGSFEEAAAAFTAYREDILGVITDIEFPREGMRSLDAGFAFAEMVRGPCPDVPIILQSSRPENEVPAREVGADFLLKGSPTLLTDLRRVISEYFGFGDFVFRLPDGTEVGRAEDLRSLEERVGAVPAASIAYHAERNHFSKWLKARTEFALAHDLRPRKLADYATVEDLRRDLVESIAGYRHERSQAAVADFDRETFDGTADFCRIGGGSLGGKARGLAFARQLLAGARFRGRFPGVEVAVPPAAVLGTDVFDRFLDDNDLRDFAIECDDEAEIASRFLAARFPEEARLDLVAFLLRVRHPLAVRSSSILEDSQYQPFAGVYATYMLPNNHPFLEVRLERLLRAVKRVYASTFSRRAKAYLKATSFRLEEEKMAVVLQRIVGSVHGSRFYPDFAGVARSHNFYPAAPLEAKDGIVAVALGLGKGVVEGGNCLRFSPRHPRHLVQFSSAADVLENSQRTFWALELQDDADDSRMGETRFDLEAAEADGTLAALGSTYSAENDAVYDGLSRAGLRVVSFAPVLKHGVFPLADVVSGLLELSAWGMGAPVELEFAVRLAVTGGAPAEFGFLQMRPLALSHESEELEIGEVARERLLCRSASVLGNGRLADVRDVVLVDAQRFDRAKSPEVALELARMNATLVAEGVAYLLVGVGRWGSRDPWLGIPVAWDQISGARAIVEAGFRDFRVTPSQGTHFFQSIASFDVGYFTVNPDAGEGFVDWDWLLAQPVHRASAFVRHLRFAEPLVIHMNGKRNQGVIFKPA